MSDQKDEEIAELRQQVQQLTKEVQSIGNHPSLFPRLGPDGNTLVKVPEINSGADFEAWMKSRKSIPAPAVKNPAAAPQPKPEETEAVLKERDKRNPVELAKSATNAEELTRFGLGIFYTQAPELVQRVPKQDDPEQIRVRPVAIDDLLSDRARELGAKEIRSTLHVFTEDNNRYVVPCEYASKVVDLGPNGELPEPIVERWANFLNDLAARGIWNYGALVKCGFVEINTLDPEKRRGVIMSFIFVDRKYYRPGAGAQQLLDELNAAVGGDRVFRYEGDVGSGDWSQEAFPW